MKVSTSPVSSEKKHPEDVSYGRNSPCTPRAVSMLRSVIAAIAITITVPNIGHAQSSSSVGQKAILVTGASTGIGRKLTEQLAAD